MLLRTVQRQRGLSWYIDYRDKDGKRKKHPLKGITTQKNADLAFADFQLKFERGLLNLATDENITLDMALEAVVKDRTRNNCSKEWISTLGIMRTTITTFFGKKRPFKSLDDDEMARYRDHRSDEIKMLPETVNKELGLITAAGRLALEQGKIAKLPWQKITYASDKVGRQAWSYMKADEIEKVLKLLRYGGKATTMRANDRPMTFDFKPRPRLWAIITFLLNTGARKGEMFALTWRAIDMRTKTVRIIGSKSAKKGKSAAIRFIPMNEALIELFCILERGGDNELVFKRDRRNVNRDFKHTLRCAELPHYRIHDLRHTFASHLAMSGTPLYTISKLLGHASTAMTSKYAHLCPDTLANAVQSLRFTAPETTV